MEGARENVRSSNLSVCSRKDITLPFFIFLVFEQNVRNRACSVSTISTQEKKRGGDDSLFSIIILNHRYGISYQTGTRYRCCSAGAGRLPGKDECRPYPGKFSAQELCQYGKGVFRAAHLDHKAFRSQLCCWVCDGSYWRVS